MYESHERRVSMRLRGQGTAASPNQEHAKKYVFQVFIKIIIIIVIKSYVKIFKKV